MQFDLRSAIFNQTICHFHGLPLLGYLPHSTYYPWLFNLQILIRFVFESIFIYSDVRVSPQHGTVLFFKQTHIIEVQHGHQGNVSGEVFDRYCFENRTLCNGIFSFRTRVPAFFHGILNHESQIVLLIDHLVVIRIIDNFDDEQKRLPSNTSKLLFRLYDILIVSNAVKISDLKDFFFLKIKVWIWGDLE
jgi:hypothetical protein